MFNKTRIKLYTWLFKPYLKEGFKIIKVNGRQILVDEPGRGRVRMIVPWHWFFVWSCCFANLSVKRSGTTGGVFTGGLYVARLLQRYAEEIKMKSKTRAIKAEQGWQKKGPCCGNCIKFSSDTIENKTPYGTYIDEKNKRCSVGGFATGKQSWCELHVFA